ncbi:MULTISPECIES: hydrogenase iron-sulfur subunit [Desulfosporosinus]|uniref:Coenzyme F420-reducing hydrogenase, delta subunit n=1 Tax=Desulfosporosinus hippei DSM 8344 TaxID=1121419 RepID=A0A1G8JKN0_9FIRM|nr:MULTISPECIES: hydrogenase iron-sulfur subunit [Desulfosporosinus]SDI31824.1 Coenzyme F420-reducing hydrogenase, delta subunit [Desulfosporosinus hippei DSM 8344]
MGEIQVEAENKKYEPKIAAFLCNWCSYAGADLAGVGRVQYPATIRTIRVPCSGRINPLYVLKAMANGADGVLVSGCHPGDCHYISGNYVARRKFALIKSLLNHVGLEEDRISFSWVSAAEGIRFAEVVKGVTERVSALGPNNGIFKVVDDGGAAADE